MTAAAFSADGSVLAVAAETIITLWDPDNNVLVAVLGEMQMVSCQILVVFSLICLQKYTLFQVNKYIIPWKQTSF